MEPMDRRKSIGPHPRPHGYGEAEKAAQFICLRGLVPRVAITLGSGLHEVVDRLKKHAKIPYKLIPYFPETTVQGHGGALHLGTWKDVPVAILEGRVHCYEGHAPSTVVFPE